MVGVEHVEEWRGQPVVDRNGEELGKLEELYFDAASAEPVLIMVKSGLLGRHTTLVPAEGASFGRDYVRVAHAREAVEAAGNWRGDEPPDEEGLTALGSAYGVRFAPGLTLESGAAREARLAQAAEARRRADELAATAQEKLAEREAAAERARVAREEAERAHQEAEAARQAALEAREHARRYE